jgi:hypothetical protein
MASLRCPLAMVSVIAAVASGAAWADDEYGTGLQRVKACSLEASARQLSGEARQNFLSACWATARKSDVMRACDIEADKRQLAGEARKTFLAQCLGER